MSIDFVSWRWPEQSSRHLLPPASCPAVVARTSALRPKAFGPTPTEGLRPAGGRRAVVEVRGFCGGAPVRVRAGLILAALAAVVLTGSSCGGPKPPSAASTPATPVG